MPRRMFGSPAWAPQIDTSTLAGTASTLLRNSAACAPTWLENPANQASVVAPSHWTAEICAAGPTGARVNCTALSDGATGPVALTCIGPSELGPSTTHAPPASSGIGVGEPSGPSAPADKLELVEAVASASA